MFLIWGARFVLIRADGEAEGPWREVRRIAQRRLDLAAELVALLKEFFPAFEKPVKLLEESHQQLLNQQAALKAPVIQARLREYEEAESQMMTDLQRLLRVVSNLPPWQEEEKFLEWQGCYQTAQQLLRSERERYNTSASAYNRRRGLFFVNWVAERFKMEPRPLFENGR